MVHLIAACSLYIVRNMVYIVKKNVVKGGDLMEAIAAKIAYNVPRVGDAARRAVCRAAS